MIEKVNPCHPDKVADRIAGAIVAWHIRRRRIRRSPRRCSSGTASAM